MSKIRCFCITINNILQTLPVSEEYTDEETFFKDLEKYKLWREEPSEKLKEHFETCGIRFIVYQIERGEEKGHDHVQGYVEYNNTKTKYEVAEHFGKAHVEGRSGTQDQAITYATKDNTRIHGPWTWGEKIRERKRKEEGEKEEMRVWKLAKEGKTTCEIIEAFEGKICYKAHHIKKITELLAEEGITRTMTNIIHFPAVTNSTTLNCLLSKKSKLRKITIL